MARKTNAKPTTKTEYSARLVILGKTYTATGETVREALLNLKPGIAKGRGVLALTHNGKTQERVLMPMLVQRLFNTAGISRDVQLKNVSMLFGV